MNKTIKFQIEKADGMEGFAAYRVSPAKAKHKTILLNVYATFLAALEEDIKPKELILEHLMHEFGHAMQEFLDIEFSEEQVEKFIKSYCDKYSEQAYNEAHGDQTLHPEKHEVEQSKHTPKDFHSRASVSHGHENHPLEEQLECIFCIDTEIEFLTAVKKAGGMKNFLQELEKTRI